METKARFGVIGSAGLIGNYHVNLLAKGEGPYQLTALCDIDAPRLAEQADKLGLPGVADYKELLARADVDAVVLAVPHPLHAPIGIAAAEAGKDVLCEKPLSHTPGLAREMVKTFKATKRIAGIHYQGRCRPAIMKVKQMIDAGELGRLLAIRVTGLYYKSDYYYTLGGWRGTWADEGGGVLINQAPHDIDTLCYLAAGDMPSELTATWTNLFHTNSQVEDMATAAGVFPNGCQFSLQVSVAAHGDASRFEIFGSAGNVTIVGGTMTKHVRFEQDLVDFARTYAGPNPYGGPKVIEQLVPQLPSTDEALLHKCFAEAVLSRKKGKLLVSAAEGLWSMETISAILLSGYLGKKVKLPVSAKKYDAMLADLIATAPPVQRVKAQPQSGMSAF